jgi:aminomethyltransferase
VRASRCGYTGEDGFELRVPRADCARIADALLGALDGDVVRPAGLAARDTLRLEAGLCLYGNDLDETTSPAEAGLMWTVAKSRIPKLAPKGDDDGAEGADCTAAEGTEGAFVGWERVARERRDGVTRRRVGVRFDSRIPVRAGAALLDADSGDKIGVVTSGASTPTVGGPIAMGYVDKASASAGTAVVAEVRGKSIPGLIAKMPFIPLRYFRINITN